MTTVNLPDNAVRPQPMTTDLDDVYAAPDTGCPECAGPWLYRLTFRHTNDCTLHAAEDATQAADSERLSGLHEVTRDTTATEHTLMTACGVPTVDAAEYRQPGDPIPPAPPAQQTTVTRDAGPILHRTIAGHDTDCIVTAAQYATLTETGQP